MAKQRGGFPMGNMANMQQMLLKAQAEMERVQGELHQKEYVATAGGGVVSATVTGKKEVVRIEMDPSVVDPDDIEMLSDLIVAAVNAAMTAADAEMEQEIARISQGLPMGR